jgi:hypothetical protein
VAVATRILAQALNGLFSLGLFLGQKARALKLRAASFELRSKLPAVSLDLTPAVRFSRRAFFFLARLGGLPLKALLSALIFLLQSRKRLKLRWRLPALEPSISFDSRRATKYGSGVLASLFVLVILGLTFVVIQRSLALRRAAKVDSGEIKIQEDYHQASRKTLVKLEPLQVLGEQFNGLSMGALFSHSGRTLKQTPTSITLLLRSVAKEFKYAEQRNLTALADGEAIKLGAMSRTGKQVEVLSDGRIEVVRLGKKGRSKGDHVLETLTLDVPTATLTKIARSKEVKMRLGETEFELTETHLTALRDILKRAAQDTAAIKRATHKRAKPRAISPPASEGDEEDKVYCGPDDQALRRVVPSLVTFSSEGQLECGPRGDEHPGFHCAVAEQRAT